MDILSCVPGPVVQLALRLHIWCVDRRDGSDQLQDEGPTMQLNVKGEHYQPCTRGSCEKLLNYEFPAATLKSKVAPELAITGIDY